MCVYNRFFLFFLSDTFSKRLMKMRDHMKKDQRAVAAPPPSKETEVEECEEAKFMFVRLFGGKLIIQGGFVFFSLSFWAVSTSNASTFSP